MPLHHLLFLSHTLFSSLRRRKRTEQKFVHVFRVRDSPCFLDFFLDQTFRQRVLGEFLFALS